jgi:hypothetical protein
MLDALKEEIIVDKVGGRFKLASLIQKRMKALQNGARPLVEIRGGDNLRWPGCAVGGRHWLGYHGGCLRLVLFLHRSSGNPR